MTSQTKLLIVAMTWATLFVLYSINRFLIRGRHLTRPSKVFLSSESLSAKPPGTLLSKVGVLLVFIVNIIHDNSSAHRCTIIVNRPLPGTGKSEFASLGKCCWKHFVCD